MKMRFRYHFVRVVPVVICAGYAISLMHPMRYFFPKRAKALEIADRFVAMSPLQKAIHEKNISVVALLVRQGADVNDCGVRWTPLNQAINAKHSALLQVLLDHGADVNRIDALGRTPLHHAAQGGFVEGVQLLLARGAHAETKDLKGSTPLHCAAGQHGALWAGEKDYCGVIELLVRAGVNCDVQDTHKRTPLHYAAMYGYSRIVNRLLRHGAHLTVFDRYRATPLHYASGKEGMAWSDKLGYCKIVHDLCTCGANIGVSDDEGKTPLHYAAACGNEHIVMFLVGYGAAVNSQDNYQATPLHYACGKDSFRFMPGKYNEHIKSSAQIKAHEKQYRNEEKVHCMIAAFLMSKGALVGVEDTAHCMPVYYAYKYKHKRIQKQFCLPLIDGSRVFCFKKGHL